MLARCIQPHFKANNVGVENSKLAASLRATDKVSHSLQHIHTYCDFYSVLYCF